MSNITYHRFLRDGRVETKDMSESHRDFHVESVRQTYPTSHVMNGVTGHRVDTITREGATLRVDWLSDDTGNAYVWFSEEGEAPRKGPECYGTIWVCGDCLHHHANGECGSCHDDEHGHDKEPLSAIGEGFTVAMGMARDEHSCREECPGHYDTDDALTSGAGIGEPVFCDGTCQPMPDECDCETNTYSTSQCEGCRSWLHGERHAMTLFKGV